MSFVLNVDGALTRFFDKQADPSFRKRCHPSMSTLGWNAYVKMWNKTLTHPGPNYQRKHSWRVPVSSAVRGAGWNCDRFLYFSFLGEEEDPIFKGVMLRVFEQGKGLEDRVYAWIMPALEDFYKDEIKFEYVSFEEYAFSSDDPASTLLGGRMDILLQYRRKDSTRSETVVIDVKSSSQSMMKKRTRGGVIEPEPEYVRQVSVYCYPREADYGLLLYWAKGWPPDFKQVEVHPRTGMVRNMLSRLEVVHSRVRKADVPSKTVGTYCAGCAYRTVCASTGD